MYATKKTANRHNAFTLIELLVVIGIILVLSALAAAFAPRVSDSQNLTRAVDRLSQWLLTAKMRAKRDGLATGIRFIGDTTGYSQFQYIQQPGPLSGGTCVGGPPMLIPPGAYQYPLVTGNYYTGGLLASSVTVPPLPSLGPWVTTVTFAGVDFSLGGLPPGQWLVQPGDYLAINNGGVYYIGAVSTAATIHLGPLGAASTYDATLTITAPTTNYRIIRQPRILIGEDPLMLPNNFAVPYTTTLIPGNIPAPPAPLNIIPNNTTIPWSNVQPGFSGVPEILFSPTGAVVGTNAGNSKILISVFDTTMNSTSPDDFMSRVGIIAIQSRTGYIGAYSANQGAGLVGYDPFYFAEIGRESGL